MALPVLTPGQREQALARAAEVRKARADALALLKAGTVTLADVLADLDSPLQRARVLQVLRAVPGVGKVTADKAMAEAGIAESRRVAGLGVNQRKALAERFSA